MSNGRRKKISEKGFTFLEILVGVVLLSIMGLGLMESSLTSLRIRTKAVRNAAALELANEALEEMAYQDPANLSDSDDVSETVTADGVSYTRVVDVTEESDGSRTIDVTVTGNNTTLGGNANVSVRLMGWGAL